MTTPEFPADQPPGAPPANLADWGTRAIGYLIDYLPIFVLYLLTFIISRVSSTLGFLLNLLVWLVGIGYFLYLGHLDGATGQTPGKQAQGIRVVNDAGELIGSGPGIARKLAHIIDSAVCLIGWFLPLFDAKRQTIADKIMSTYVVRGVEKKPFGVDLYLPKSQEQSS
ncbi:MAG: RDD family protein [Acidimicrobiia bacterium]